MSNEAGGGDVALTGSEQALIADEGKREQQRSFDVTQLQAILNVLPAYTWYAAPSGALTFVNRRTAEYLGLPHDHPLRSGIDIGAQWDDWVPLLHPDDREQARKYWSDSLRMGVAGAHSYRVASAQGDYRWFLTSFEPLRASDGTLLLWIGATLDIDEAKTAEERLRRSEAYLAETQRLTQTGSWAWDPRSKQVLYCSDEMFRIYGLDRQKDLPTRKNFRQRVHPEDRSRVDESFARVVNEKVDSFDEYRVVMPDRRVKHVNSSGHPVLDGNGELIEFVGTATDVTERKRAERDLIRSEAYLADTQRLTHTGSWAWDPRSQKVLYCSEEMFRLFGLDPQEGLPGRERFRKQIHPEDRDRIREKFERSLREGVQSFDEYRVVLPDGTVRHIYASGHPMLDADGEVIEFVGTATDVTGRKHADQALRESEAKFRDYAETASDWFWEIGPDYKFTLSTENAFGSDPSHRIGTACWDHALDLETEPEKWRLVRDALDARNPFRDFVYSAVGGNGAPMYVRASGKPVFDSNGEFRGYRGTGTDITERKRGEEMLREAESRFRTYVDHATDALFVHDGRQLGKIIDVNRQACESLGYTREELIGMTPLDFDPNMDEVSLQRVLERIDAGEIVTFETSHRPKDGAVFPVEVRARPFRYEGHPLVLSLARNITDRKWTEESLRKMQMELAHANRIAMMGQLTASIAHEVNQPIATARNNASAALKFLDRNPPDLAEVREALGCVVSDSERASAVIDRIREHIKKAPARKESFDLNDAITEVIALTRVDMANSRVGVQISLAAGLRRVEGDRVQLQQVALNLILNAVEAMISVVDGPRELLISTERTEADGVLVAVRDSGPGIDPKSVERLFESFYTTKPSGLGLGLSICRSIVEAHGGRLWAGANEPRGAAFQFTLPAPDDS